MASIRISQLAAVGAVNANDVLVINDGDINTRKITYENFTQGLITTSGNGVINGDLTISGTLNAGGLVIDSPLISVDSVNNRIGINVETPGYTLDVDGDINIKSGSTLRFNDVTNGYAITFQSPTLNSSLAFALPANYPGSNGQVLASTTTGALSWTNALIDPMQSPGEMIIRNVSNVTDRLPVGNFGQVLAIQGDGTPGWQNNSAGFTDPTTTPGDIIIKDQAGVTTRLGIGSPGEALIVNAGGNEAQWSTVTAGAGGANTEVQLNSSGVLAGTPDFTYDSVTNTVQVDNFNCDSNAVLGSIATDTVSIAGKIIGDITPSLDDTSSLGEAGLAWSELWLKDTINFNVAGTLGSVSYSIAQGYEFAGQGVGKLSAALSLNDELGNNSVKIEAPFAANLATSYTLTLPGDSGSNESALVTDGTGTLSWANVVSLAELKLALNASANFATFKAQILALPD